MNGIHICPRCIVAPKDDGDDGPAGEASALRIALSASLTSIEMKIYDGFVHDLPHCSGLAFPGLQATAAKLVSGRV
jgi:hypothetical protein